MEEEQKGEFFQTPSQFESDRLSRSGSKKSTKKYLIIIVLIVVLGLLIFGVTRFMGGTPKENTADVTPEPTFAEFPTDTPAPTEEIGTPTPSEKPTTTPKPAVNSVDKTTGLDRSKLSVHVLNGSGTAGASRTASDFLESLGYNVIQIGNADNFNYENTVIQVRSSSSNFLPLLKKDVSAKYTVGSASANLASDERADAIVIVGKQ